MKISMHRYLIILIILFFTYPLSSNAQSIIIKELYIGMPKSEVENKFPGGRGFTIAKVYSKYSSADFQYRDDKLARLMFLFDSKNFETVFDAVKEKYPGIYCKSTQVNNSMGATFEQIQCMMEDTESILQLSRYVNDITTSALTLTSRKLLDEEVKKIKQKNKDI